MFEGMMKVLTAVVSCSPQAETGAITLYTANNKNVLCNVLVQEQEVFTCFVVEYDLIDRPSAVCTLFINFPSAFFFKLIFFMHGYFAWQYQNENI